MLITGADSHKGEKVHKINASILNRSNRKYWYVKYQVLFENENVKKEESTKVLKTEKSLKFMQTKYLPVWIARKKDELSIVNYQSKIFSHYASIFLKDFEKFHDYQNVKYRMDRILLDFAALDVRKITKLQIKQWINLLINNNTGNELVKNSKLKYLRIFHGVFELALDDNVIERNFTYDIKITGMKRDLNDIKPFSVEQVNQLLIYSTDKKYGELLNSYLGLAFNQGMSPSEIIGLQVSDIDLVNQTISIKRNITKGKIKETKTLYRERLIPIFDITIPYIRELIDRANKVRSIWLFSREDGSNLVDIKDIRGNKLLLKDNKIIKRNSKWYLLLNDLGIEYIDIKNCRHTFTVSAIESKKFTLQEIADILGHSDLNMLINHYAKWINGKALHANKEVNLFGDTLGGTSKKMILKD